MDKELDKLLAVSRRKKIYERHVTGKATTNTMLPEVARMADVPKRIARKVMYAHLRIISEHLMEHNTVSLRGIGTFYFVKARPRKVAKLQKGTKERKTEVVGPSCRLKFRVADCLKKIAYWFPVNEIDKELSKEEDRTKRFEDFLGRNCENAEK